MAGYHHTSPAEVAVAGVGVGGRDVCAEMEKLGVSRTLSLVLGSFPRVTPRDRSPEQFWRVPIQSSNLPLVTQPQVCIFKTFISLQQLTKSKLLGLSEGPCPIH